MLVSKINFQYTKHINHVKNITFRGEYDERVERLEDNSSIFSSDYWNAESIVERNMRDEINNLERQIARKEAELQSREQAARSATSYHSSSLSSKRSQLSNIKSQINYNNGTVISSLQRTLSQLGSQESSLKSANDSARSMIMNQNSTMNKIKDETKDILSANAIYEKELRNKTMQKKKMLEVEYDKKIDNLKVSINNSIIKPDPILQEINTPKPNGFGKIAGFVEVKKMLNELLGKYIVLEKHGKTVDVPDAVLLYGPDTNNNKEFANILASQYEIPAIQIETIGTDVERFNQLKEASIKAKTNFEQGNVRTLIIVNDFDKFINSERLTSSLKSYLDDLSKDYHATLIAVSSTPEKLNDILLRSGRFGAKIAIPAICKKDIFSCFIKYLPIDVVDSFNIDMLVQKLEETRNGGAYTVKQIKDFIASLVGSKRLQNVLPKIKQETLQMFKKQIEYMKHI